jgi:hypothetical protein
VGTGPGDSVSPLQAIKGRVLLSEGLPLTQRF